MAINEKTPSGEFTQIPIDRDGTIPLSTIQAQFGDTATGLKYKSEKTNKFNNVRLNNGALFQPTGAWGSGLYVVVILAGMY